MKIVLTGAHGFLGWHTRVRLRSLTDHEVVTVGRENWSKLDELIEGADAVIHVAGVNRGTPSDVEHVNVALAEDVAQAVRQSRSVTRVVFANSIWAGTASPYGAGKASANFVLADAASDAGAAYVDVRLPNLFGEHGRPHYNSFVATFVNSVLNAQAAEIVDKPIDLLHVQDAAQALIDGLTTSLNHLEPLGHPTTVQGVYDQLHEYFGLYRTGEVPELGEAFDVNLFNTLRAAMFPTHYPIPLKTHADERGSLVETVRSHGGGGQSFASTTHPGITRGEHFHLSKVERFVVLSGQGRISLRKVFHDDVVHFDVTGEDPVVIDMPTMWVHNITNTGDTELLTQFWTNALFDPDRPDTYWEPVGTGAVTELLTH